jgi:hypothetical protein
MPKNFPASVWLVKSHVSLVSVFITTTATPSRSVVFTLRLARASADKGLFSLCSAVAIDNFFLVSTLTTFPLCVKDNISLCSGDIFFYGGGAEHRRPLKPQESFSFLIML